MPVKFNMIARLFWGNMKMISLSDILKMVLLDDKTMFETK